MGQVPIYARRFTLALLRFKLEEHRLLDKAELIEVRPGVPVQVGPFETEFVPLTHSTPDCAAVALSTAAGTVVHTGDFGIEYVPVEGRRSDLPALARLGDRGVQLLLADSTNAEEGPPPSPLPTRDVQSELSRIFATARGRVLVTTFSSHIHRVQQVLNAAYLDGRVVALLGRSLTRNVKMASNLADPEAPSPGTTYLSPPPGTLVSLKELETHPRDEQVLICTGSQGEPMAALSRIARGEHNQVQIEPGDTVLYSSSTVPGNELAVNEIVNRLVRAEAEFITERQNPKVHVSGHGSASDLLLMLELLRPSIFAPIHGEARHQRAHSELAQALGIPADRIHVLDNGDVLEVTRRLGADRGPRPRRPQLRRPGRRRRHHRERPARPAPPRRRRPRPGRRPHRRQRRLPGGRDRDRHPRLRLGRRRGAHRGDPPRRRAQPGLLGRAARHRDRRPPAPAARHRRLPRPQEDPAAAGRRPGDPGGVGL